MKRRLLICLFVIVLGLSIVSVGSACGDSSSDKADIEQAILDFYAELSDERETTFTVLSIDNIEVTDSTATADVILKNESDIEIKTHVTLTKVDGTWHFVLD